MRRPHEYGLDIRDREARDAFWWIVLGELRSHTRVTEVSMTVAPQSSVDSIYIGFAVEGLLTDLVRPLPSAATSLEEIRRILNQRSIGSEPTGTPPPSTIPPAPPDPSPPPGPAPVPPGPEGDPTSIRYSMMELD